MKEPYGILSAAPGIKSPEENCSAPKKRENEKKDNQKKKKKKEESNWKIKENGRKSAFHRTHEANFEIFRDDLLIFLKRLRKT